MEYVKYGRSTASINHRRSNVPGVCQGDSALCENSRRLTSHLLHIVLCEQPMRGTLISSVLLSCGGIRMYVEQ